MILFAVYSFIPRFQYVKLITFIFFSPGYITHQFNDQLLVGLLAQLVTNLMTSY